MSAGLSADLLVSVPALLGLTVSHAGHLSTLISFLNMHVSHVHPSFFANASSGLTVAGAGFSAGLAVSQAWHLAKLAGFDNIHASQLQESVFLNLRRGLSIPANLLVNAFFSGAAPGTLHLVIHLITHYTVHVITHYTPHYPTQLHTN